MSEYYGQIVWLKNEKERVEDEIRALPAAGAQAAGPAGETEKRRKSLDAALSRLDAVIEVYENLELAPDR